MSLKPTLQNSPGVGNEGARREFKGLQKRIWSLMGCPAVKDPTAGAFAVPFEKSPCQ